MKRILAIILLAAALTASTAAGQTIKSLGYNTTNGEVVYSGTNPLTLTNPLQFATNARAATRTNLGATTVGNSVFTATNAAAAATAVGLGTTNDVQFNKTLSQSSVIGGGVEAFLHIVTLQQGEIQIGFGAADFEMDELALTLEQTDWKFYKPFSVPNATNQAIIRTNLGLGATNAVTFGNVILDNDGNLAPAQTADSSDSLMTRGLTDDRYGDFRNTMEINNFTGLTQGQTNGGSTGIFSAHVQMRAVAGGNSFRSFETRYMGSLNAEFGAMDAGSRSSRALVSLFADSRAFAAFYPLLGVVSSQWAGRGVGTITSFAVVPYWLYYDAEWRAIKATQVRGSTTVFPVRSNNIITIECNGAHNLTTNDFVSVAGVFPVNMQTYRAAVLDVPSSNTFTYANVGTNATGTTISGDSMNINKIEELGSVPVTTISNVFSRLASANNINELRVDVSTNGTATFFHNGSNAATGSDFTVTFHLNAARVGFAVETETNATTQSDLFVLKFRHTINP